MCKLIYSITTSLDGYVADKKGDFDWTEATEEILVVVDDVLKNVGTFLFGRQMYKTMAVWDTIPADGPSEGFNQFAKIWKAANKIVYSTSLTKVTTDNTTLEHEFNTEYVNKLVKESNKDFNIGGPYLAAEAIKAGIVDEFHQYIVPKIIGGGNHWLPNNVEAELKLIEIRKFKNGTVHLHYRKI
jgi:dihydrofolate reductase